MAIIPSIIINKGCSICHASNLITVIPPGHYSKHILQFVKIRIIIIIIMILFDKNTWRCHGCFDGANSKLL